jgi:hypothetical protein
VPDSCLHTDEHGRGQYLANVPPAELRTILSDKIEPLEAQNAVRIAWWTNAATYAPESYAKAKCLLQQAEESLEKDSESVSTIARAAVQAAEDARWIALRRQKQASKSTLGVRRKLESFLSQV